MIRVFLLPVLALIGVIFGLRTVIMGAVPPPAAPLFVEPARAPYDKFVAGVGLVEASSENVSLAPRVGGVVETLHVSVGDSVQKGAALMSLDSRDIAAQIEVQRSALVAAQHEAEDAQAKLGFRRAVSQRGAVTAEELSSLEYALKIASARRDQIAALIRSLEIEVERRIVRAPFDGQVLQLKARPGEYVPAQLLSSPVILFGRTKPLHLRVDIDENDAWRIEAEKSGVAFLRGNKAMQVALTFVRFEPYVLPKRSLTGESSERVDTRVLQVIYEFDRAALPIFVGQLMDVYIESRYSASDTTRDTGSPT